MNAAILVRFSLRSKWYYTKRRRRSSYDDEGLGENEGGYLRRSYEFFLRGYLLPSLVHLPRTSFMRLNLLDAKSDAQMGAIQPTLNGSMIHTSLVFHD